MGRSSDAQPASGGTGRSLAARVFRPLVAVVILGFAVHLLLPQVASLQEGLRALRGGRWPFLALALVGSGLSYAAGAWMVRASVEVPPAWGRTTVVQMAASAAAIVTPAGVGWVAVNEGFLRKSGVDPSTARAATGLNMVLTVVSHIGLLLLLLPFLPTLQLPTISVPQRRVFVDVIAALGATAGILFWIPRWRKKTIELMQPILAALPGVVRDPRRSARMAAGAISINLAYGLALYGAVAAFGGVPTPFGVLVAYMVAATVAVIAPTPGGLGVMETALVAALTRLAIPAGQAVAATLAFRLATFWIPLAVGGFALRKARREDWV